MASPKDLEELAQKSAAIAELRLVKMDWLKHPYTQSLIKDLAKEEDSLLELIIGANNLGNSNTVSRMVSELKAKRELLAKLKNLMHDAV
jgi:iron-sulfur cluster repair protein YtfE (RIC family)